LIDLAIGVSNNALFINLPLAVFLCGALIMVLLTLGQRDLTLNEVALPIQFNGDTGVAFLMHGREKFSKLFAVKEQLLNAGGVGDDMGARCVEWRDLASEEEGFAVFKQHITVDELNLFHAQAFDFPAL